jgi:phospholipid/cholesterol/gamma-HCH transport system substrate-binding protein
MTTIPPGPGPAPKDPDEDLPTPVTRGRDQALWLGIFLVLGLVAVLGALFILTDAAVFRGRYIVKTNVPTAGGIRRGDPVQMNGVNIGRIQRFFLHAEPGVRKVEIRLELEGEYDNIPSDSSVVLESAGMLGGMRAVIVPGQASTYLKGGEVLPGSTKKGMLDDTDALAADAQRVADEATKTLTRMQSLLSDTTIKNVEATTTSAEASSRELRVLLKDLSATVAEQRKQLSTLTASLQRSSEGLEKVTTGPELDRARARIDAMTEKMQVVSETLERSSKSFETVAGRMDRGEGTLGKLSRDEELYKNLNQAALNMAEATANANKLIEDIKKDPKKYFKMSVF